MCAVVQSMFVFKCKAIRKENGSKLVLCLNRNKQNRTVADVVIKKPHGRNILVNRAYFNRVDRIKRDIILWSFTLDVT